MKKILLIVIIALVVFSFSMNIFAYHTFLSDECNVYLEELKEKFREKEIVSEEEHGFVWAVILAKNDGVEIEEIKEDVYNDETGRFERYTFTCITVFNARGPTRVVYGSASAFHPYDQPKLIFIYKQ